LTIFFRQYFSELLPVIFRQHFLGLLPTFVCQHFLENVGATFFRKCWSNIFPTNVTTFFKKSWSMKGPCDAYRGVNRITSNFWNKSSGLKLMPLQPTWCLFYRRRRYYRYQVGSTDRQKGLKAKFEFCEVSSNSTWIKV
jgi:hypothetical protein